MKLNLELITELLQDEVLRLRSKEKRQGGVAAFFEPSGSEEKTLAEQTFEPIKNLTSEGTD